MRRPRPLADLIETCLAPSLAAQGFATSDVITAWPDIVGERLAAFTLPMKLEWKRRGAGAERDARPEPGTLVVRVESAFALEMQHLAPVVMERVNAHYGWRCVGRIVLKQGPVRRDPPPRREARELAEAERQRIGAAVGAIADADLKAALDRLGQAVVRSQRRTKA
ncbi:MAG TPA: DciA family protein [Microvirga sp.]|jgi:hypothetical protein|nr:DciA family protein [Microvirga sp.]